MTVATVARCSENVAQHCPVRCGYVAGRQPPPDAASRCHADSARRAGSRARSAGAGRALRGNQPPLHDRRDTRHGRSLSRKLRRQSSPRYRRPSARDTHRSSCTIRRPTFSTSLPRSEPEAKQAPPIRVDDPDCVSSRVFRTQHPLIVPAGKWSAKRSGHIGAARCCQSRSCGRHPSGGEPLGVVNLSDRRSRQPFSAGDQKLVAAIATQIGTAIQNARLVRASIEQQRLMQEMYLAHDLQMKLLPKTSIVAPEAIVAARVVPAESVGGDFYHLFRMPRNRTGVMIGDVSGHGYRAALIMALAMSASAIHAQSARDPGEMLSMLLAIAARGACDDGDVHLRFLRRDRPQRRASFATQTPGIRMRSS